MKHLLNKKVHGFTLIELMIAILLGSLLIILLISLFINSKQSYRMQENLSRLQENGSFAMKFISRDVRMADFWGCLQPTPAGPGNVPPANLANNIAVGNAADGYFDIFATSNLSGGNNNANNGDTIRDGTDTISVKGAANSSTASNLTATMANSTSAVQIPNNHSFSQSEFVLITDCDSGDLFRIVNAAENGSTLSHGAASDRNTDPGFIKAYGPTAQVYHLNFVTYSIQTSAAGDPALFRNINNTGATELVEGVEDMQILYGEDITGADGIADTYRTADLVNMDNVVSVRVSLVVSSLDDNLTTAPVSYTLPGGVIVNSTDNRLRQVFTSTIALRNRIL